jgi:hypothetical protein
MSEGLDVGRIKIAAPMTVAIQCCGLVLSKVLIRQDIFLGPCFYRLQCINQMFEEQL